MLNKNVTNNMRLNAGVVFCSVNLKYSQLRLFNPIILYREKNTVYMHIIFVQFCDLK